MNDTQTVYTIFFAISWGIVANALTRWKAFNFGLIFRRDFGKPTIRILSAFLLLNCLPWLLFVLTLYALNDVGRKFGVTWNVCDFGGLVFSAILPGLAPFGCYRLWLAWVESSPTSFYAATKDELPSTLRGRKRNPIDPTIEDLGLSGEGLWRNLVAAVVYLACSGLAWLGVK